jgi:hypothetical protein
MGKSSPIDVITLDYIIPDITIEDALNSLENFDNSGDLSEILPAIDKAVQGLNDGAYSIECEQALKDAFFDNSGHQIQPEILARLMMSDAPSSFFEDFVNDILEHNTPNSLTYELSNREKDYIREIAATDIAQRAEKIAEFIQEKKQENPSNNPTQSKFFKSAFWVQENNGEIILIDFEETGRYSERNEYVIISNLGNLSLEDASKFESFLKDGLTGDEEFGRRLGFQTSKAYQGGFGNQEAIDIASEAIVKAMSDSGDNKVARDNFISFFREVGTDIAIEKMTPEQNREYLPRLLGGGDKSSLPDIFLESINDVKTELETKGKVSLSSLATKGIGTIPILFDYLF